MRAFPLSLQALPTLLVVALAPIGAQPLDVPNLPPEDFVGADQCGACHPDQLESQSTSGHANSLSPASEHSLASAFAPSERLARPPGLQYVYVSDEQGLSVEVSDHSRQLGLQLEWAFGAGAQAVTFVGQADEDRYLEHHFSYYARTDSLAPTPGHRDQPAETLEDALGVYYETFGADSTIMRCFQCHSTGPLELGASFALSPHEHGVRCEACHGAGRRHVEAVQTGNGTAVRESIGNPRRFTGDELLRFCGACHRPPASSTENLDWSDPWNVRHQPVYLSRSACYQSSGRTLLCMNCHEPHAPLARRLAQYDGTCQNCHGDDAPPSEICRQEPARACASCHMPVVTPQPGLRFTNHWIGIYDDRSRLRPAAQVPSVHP